MITPDIRSCTGPFGALFGAQIGATFGAKRASNEVQKKEMERMGLTPEMVEMAQEVGAALERGLEGLQVNNFYGIRKFAACILKFTHLLHLGM